MCGQTLGKTGAHVSKRMRRLTVTRSGNSLPNFIHANPVEHFEGGININLFLLFEFRVGRVYSPLMEV